MAARTTFATTAVLLCSSLTACEASTETIDDEAEPDFRALITEKDVSFEVVTFPREATGPAMRSEGYLMVRLQGGPASTGPASPPQPDDILGTCGVTFVSPTIAVTAGHCLPGLAENELVEVRVARALPGYEPDGAISGTFPDYQHEGPLDGDGDGTFQDVYDWHYDYDQYQCSVQSRCYDDLPEINCDITHPGVPPLADNTPDIGIIQCVPWGSGTHHHDYVNVADTVAVDDLVAMPWYHEVYDANSPGVDPAEFSSRYLQSAATAGGYGNHYHYRGGGERHEILPLMSTDYYGSTWRVLSIIGAQIRTNLVGCHGTSGSGIMKKNAADYPELIGPVTVGNNVLRTQLCQAFDADNPDIYRIATIRPDITNYFVQAYLPSSCSEPDSFPNRLAYWLTCDRHMLGVAPDLVELFPFECQVCEMFMRMGSASNMGMEMSAANAIGLGLRPNEAGTLHRASVRVWVDSFPTTVELRMGNQVIAERELVGQEPFVGNHATAVLAGSFVPDATTDELTIAVQQGSAAQTIRLSDVMLVDDGAPGAFETMHNRFGFGLVDAYDQDPHARLMSFGGSEKGGVAALLDEDERMVATGYALVEDTKWTVTPVGDEIDLQCGMIFADGHEIAQSCYGNEPITVDAVGHGEPVALFVQNTEAGQGLVSLTDFIVEQSSAPSCTPPSHDRCDTGPALSQPSCDPCVESICTVDPYCCSTYWDSICVGEVTSVCNETCSDCAHDPCQTGQALESGCDGQQGCVTAICNADPYCCNTSWDSICVGEVGSICNQSC